MGKKFREKVPKLKWKYRVCLYLLAIFAGVFAVIGSQLVALPKWAGVVTHVVAFILVVISCLHAAGDNVYRVEAGGTKGF